MLINQMRNSSDFAKFKEIPVEYFQNIEKKSSKELLQIISQVITLLLSRLNVPLKEIHTVTDRLWKGETNMLFDSFEGYDIQKVRKDSQEQGEIAKAYRTARNMYDRGFPAEETAGLVEESLETVKGWYESWKEGSDS